MLLNAAAPAYVRSEVSCEVHLPLPSAMAVSAAVWCLSIALAGALAEVVRIDSLAAARNLDSTQHEFQQVVAHFGPPGEVNDKQFALFVSAVNDVDGMLGSFEKEAGVKSLKTKYICTHAVPRAACCRPL